MQPKCEICGETFLNNAALKSHQRSKDHRAAEERARAEREGFKPLEYAFRYSMTPKLYRSHTGWSFRRQVSIADILPDNPPSDLLRQYDTRMVRYYSGGFANHYYDAEWYANTKRLKEVLEYISNLCCKECAEAHKDITARQMARKLRLKIRTRELSKALKIPRKYARMLARDIEQQEIYPANYSLVTLTTLPTNLKVVGLKWSGRWIDWIDYTLLAIDDKQCRLVHVYGSIEGVFPPRVIEALRNGEDVLRQGDVYLVRAPLPTTGRIKYRNNAPVPGFTNHHAQFLAIAIKDFSGRVFVRGALQHPQHPPLQLPDGWWEVVGQPAD